MGVCSAVLVATLASCGGQHEGTPVSALARSLAVLERQSLPPNLADTPSRLARSLAFRPSDVGRGAKYVPNPPPATVPVACHIRDTLSTAAVAHAVTPLMEVGSATLSGIVGIYTDRESAIGAYSALTAKHQGDCYTRLVRHEIHKQAPPSGSSAIVEEHLASPLHGCVYEVLTSVLGPVGELWVSAKIAVLQQGASVFVTISSVVAAPDNFDLLDVTVDAVIHRYRALLKH